MGRDQRFAVKSQSLIKLGILLTDPFRFAMMEYGQRSPIGSVSIIPSRSFTSNTFDSSSGKIVAGTDARNRSDDCSKAAATSWCTVISLLA